MPVPPRAAELLRPRFWAAVPAAGIGRRFGADIPKQYLPIDGRTLLEHVLEQLCSHPAITGVAVALREDDRWWPDVEQSLVRRLGARAPLRAGGGRERCHSVLAMLDTLAAHAAAQDWVLVHDAARPCVRRDDLDRLMQQGAEHAVGAVLGVPVRDTMKRTDAQGNVLETVSREHLWHAQTPQMFRLQALREALGVAIAQGVMVTDEAQAMEYAGLRPRMVEGHADNIKVTHAEDLQMAAMVQLRQRGLSP